jgi:hypothetical protein
VIGLLERAVSLIFGLLYAKIIQRDCVCDSEKLLLFACMHADA